MSHCVIKYTVPGITLALEKDGQTYYYHADGLGSIVALTNSAGAKIQSYVYDSFGNFSQDGNINQPFTYTGREFDPETGLYYYRARYYDAKVGRFITRDPIGFDGGDVNLYVYVWNNPVIWIDPWGLSGKWTKTGPNWCDWRYDYSDRERKVIRDEIDKSGLKEALNAPHHPIHWEKDALWFFLYPWLKRFGDKDAKLLEPWGHPFFGGDKSADPCNGTK